MHRAVVNYASGKWYPRGQERLRKSLISTGFTGKFMGWQNTKVIGGPTHSQVPYAFKTFSLMYAWTHGFESMIYVDSSIWAVKSWEPIWNIIETKGWYFEEAGHWVGTWTKDSVLQRFGMTRDQAMKIPMFTAGFTGLNIHNPKAQEFLIKWHEAANDGDSFKGTWGNENKQMSKDPRCKGHRHDMSVASILAWKLGMDLGKGGTFLAYIGKAYGTPKSSVVAYLQSCP